MSRSWDSFAFHPEINSYLLDTLQFAQPTPTQASSIPLLLGNKDVAVEAATGSGKSLAFALPLVQRLLSEVLSRSTDADSANDADSSATHQVVIRSLLMSPTRELAQQIADVLEHLVSHCGVLQQHFSVACLYGGRPDEQEKRQLVQKSATPKMLLVVGTPGRVRYGLDRSLMKRCDYVVLDEADRLFDKSFSADVQVILGMLPKQRRTYLFSATLPSEGSEIVKLAGMRNPALVRVKRSEGTHDIPSTLSNFFHVIRQQDKLEWLLGFVSNRAATTAQEKAAGPAGAAKGSGTRETIVIFYLTCASVEYHHAVVSKLKPELRLFKLHGKLSQTQRNKTMQNLRESGGVLFCTDLVARGIDLPSAAWIVQFDCPQDVSFFVHRVGRTARAGRDGSAVCLLLENEVDAYTAFLAQRSVPLVPLPAELAELAGRRAGEGVPPVNALVEQIRTKLTAVDREFLNKASAAFVSFVRAYQEHQLKYIFALKELPLGDIALSFACLQVPRIKEILGKKVTDWVASEVKSESVPFLDKAKEARRQEQLRVKAEEKAEEAAVTAKQKTQKKQAEQQAVAKEAHQRTRSEKREAKRKGIEDEWADLQEEERMAKKFKRGKITKKDFDKFLLKRRDDSDFDAFSDASDSDESAGGSTSGASSASSDEE